MTFFKNKSKYCLNFILLLDTKLLINMNHLEYFFKKIFVDAKNLTKYFTSVDVAE